MSKHGSLPSAEISLHESHILLKSPGGDRPKRPDRIPLSEPVRPQKDDDSGDQGRRDEAELPGEGGTYDRD